MSKKLSKEQVDHIASLARIGICEEENEKLQSDLGAVLDYVDKLDMVDISDVVPTAHVSGLENETRKDENGSAGSPQAGSTHADPKVLFDMAPDKKEGYVKVKQVLNK